MPLVPEPNRKPFAPRKFTLNDEDDEEESYSNEYIEEAVDGEDFRGVSKSEDTKANAGGENGQDDDQEFIFIHEDGFNIKISAPGLDPFEIQVSSMEAVQEIHHILMDREETCSRTCFSLSFENNKLDRFVELKSIPNLKEGSVLKVIEEPYTVREARIHMRHIRDLLRCLNQADAYFGQECRSLTFLNSFAEVLDLKRTQKSTPVDCTPPSYILPDEQCELPNQGPPLSKLTCLDSLKQNLQALKMLSTSGWNPPPGPRKLHGDLLYLQVVTLENKRFHLTCCTKGFFVNQSTDDEFNPSAASPNIISHSLVDLLNQLSPAFKRNFSQIQKRRREKHPFERVATPYQVFTWTSPVLDHCVDAIRAEDASSSKLGYEEHLPGQTRDWNEELQTIRSLPKQTLPQRLIRERAMFKVHSDFVAAATRGAVAVIDGNVLAINPGVDKRLQMFIWHGIFFSLGFDVSDHYKHLGGDHAAHVAPNLDLQGVVAYNAVDGDNVYMVGTVVIDYQGYRVVAQTIISGIMDRDQEESVVYGSIDFGRTVVENKKYEQLLSRCAKQLRIRPHKVLNIDEEEVMLYSSVECKGIIGNDGRHYILDLLHTFPPDANYLTGFEQQIRPEVKAAGYPKNYKHKLACLRQELLEEYQKWKNLKFLLQASKKVHREICNKKKEGDLDGRGLRKDVVRKLQEMAEGFVYTEFDYKLDGQEKNEEGQEKANDDSSSSLVSNFAMSLEQVQMLAYETKFNMLFNPDAFSPLVRHAKYEPIEQQRKLIRNVSNFLLLEVLPKFVQDCTQSNSLIWDGATLSSTMHERGINIRYLGRLVELLQEQQEKNQQLAYLTCIAMTELVCRSAKHVFARYLQTVDTAVSLASAISLFLNCFLSACHNVNPLGNSDSFNTTFATVVGKRKNKKNKKTNQSISGDIQEWIHFNPTLLFESLRDEMQSHYSYKLSANSMEELIEHFKLHKLCILRNFSRKVGLQIVQQDYALDSNTKPTFVEEDVLNVFPIVKHVHPTASDAYHFFKTGYLKLQQGDLKSASDLLCEALNLMNNVYGAIHPEIVLCLRALARIHYLQGQNKDAVSNQQKAVLMCEKVHGVDNALCIPEYVQLALYSFANQQCTDTLQCLYRAKYLLLLCAGPLHPEHGTLDANIGLVLHTFNEQNASLRFLRSALKIYQAQYGQKSLKVALCHHLVAVSRSALGDCREALQSEIEAYRLYKTLLGEQHEKTKMSSDYLKLLTNQAVQMQKRLTNSSSALTNGVSELDKRTPSPQPSPPIDYEHVMQTLNVINGVMMVQLSAVELDAIRACLLAAGNQQGESKEAETSSEIAEIEQD